MSPSPGHREPGSEDNALADLQGHSITYRIALGPHRGRKAFTLQSLPPSSASDSTDWVAQASGFSLHAGVAAEAHQRGKLERLCRYIARSAVAIERWSLTTIPTKGFPFRYVASSTSIRRPASGSYS
jgi:hypothetical protein